MQSIQSQIIHPGLTSVRALAEHRIQDVLGALVAQLLMSPNKATAEGHALTDKSVLSIRNFREIRRAIVRGQLKDSNEIANRLQIEIHSSKTGFFGRVDNWCNGTKEIEMGSLFQNSADVALVGRHVLETLHGAAAEITSKAPSMFRGEPVTLLEQLQECISLAQSQKIASGRDAAFEDLTGHQIQSLDTFFQDHPGRTKTFILFWIAHAKTAMVGTSTEEHCNCVHNLLNPPSELGINWEAVEGALSQLRNELDLRQQLSLLGVRDHLVALSSASVDSLDARLRLDLVREGLEFAQKNASDDVSATGCITAAILRDALQYTNSPNASYPLIAAEVLQAFDTCAALAKHVNGANDISSQRRVLEQLQERTGPASPSLKGKLAETYELLGEQELWEDDESLRKDWESYAFKMRTLHNPRLSKNEFVELAQTNASCFQNLLLPSNAQTDGLIQTHLALGRRAVQALLEENHPQKVRELVGKIADAADQIQKRLEALQSQRPDLSFMNALTTLDTALSVALSSGGVKVAEVNREITRSTSLKKEIEQLNVLGKEAALSRTLYADLIDEWASDVEVSCIPDLSFAGGSNQAEKIRNMATHLRNGDTQLALEIADELSIETLADKVDASFIGIFNQINHKGLNHKDKESLVREISQNWGAQAQRAALARHYDIELEDRETPLSEEMAFLFSASPQISGQVGLSHLPGNLLLETRIKLAAALQDYSETTDPSRQPSRPPRSFGKALGGLLLGLIKLLFWHLPKLVLWHTPRVFIWKPAVIGYKALSYLGEWFVDKAWDKVQPLVSAAARGAGRVVTLAVVGAESLVNGANTAASAANTVLARV